MSRVGATLTASPNFGLELAVRKTSPEQRTAWDLSPLATLVCAAEPIRAATVDRFLGAFAAAGLRPECFCPTYGLAEATVSVSSWGRGRIAVDADEVARGRVVQLPAQAGNDRRTTVYVGCGRITKPGSRVRIVDPDTRTPCADDRIGEIWVDSATKAAGYYGRPRESLDGLHAEIHGESDPRRYLRTGDLGFFADGELYITGRRKDMIILHGRNHYAEDLEESVRRCHPSIRPGGVAAFAVDQDEAERTDDRPGSRHARPDHIRSDEPRPDQARPGHARPQPTGSETAAILVEVASFEACDAPAAEELAAAVRRALALDHQIGGVLVVLVPPGTVPKTTSGKVRRHACKELYLAGGFGRAITVPAAPGVRR
jgi:acyl-CoA synthetase (AMP-forming)/AMP-acid ligase II